VEETVHEFHSDNVILPKKHEEIIGRFTLEKRVTKELKAGGTQKKMFWRDNNEGKNYINYCL
jgi:hypothetical protein